MLTDLVRTDESVVAVGIDTADVDQVAAAAARFGVAYLGRVATLGERAQLPPRAPDRGRALARLWAAKEAVTKTLAPPADLPWPWTDVEVLLDDQGRGAVRLHGRAARLAAHRGVDRIVFAPAPAADEPLPPNGATVTVLALALSRTSRAANSPTKESTTDMSDVLPRLRQVLAEHAGLDADAQTIASDADLFDAGMSSHASVNMMLAIEDEFDIEFPDELLQRATFATLDSMESAVTRLQDE